MTEHLTPPVPAGPAAVPAAAGSAAVDVAPSDAAPMSRSALHDRPDRFARVPWGAVALFVGLALGLAWLIALPLWLRGPEDPGFAPLFSITAQAMMFTPALAALAVVFLMRSPRTNRARLLGLWPLRPAARVVWFIVGALVVPPLVVAGSVAIAAACGWVTLDLVNFSGFQETIAATVPESALSLMPPVGTLVALQLLAIPLGTVINSVLAFGEELGWRGWLLPALRPLGVWPALIGSGVVWGLWHAPVILLGYNFGLTDWRGVALMIIGCVAWGILLGWSRLRSGSVWPAVVGHAALNASGSLVLLVAAAGVELNPVLVVPVGVAGWLAIALVVVVLVLTGQFSPAREPELAGPKPSRLERAAALTAQPAEPPATPAG